MKKQVGVSFVVGSFDDVLEFFENLRNMGAEDLGTIADELYEKLFEKYKGLCEENDRMYRLLELGVDPFFTNGFWESYLANLNKKTHYGDLVFRYDEAQGDRILPTQYTF